MMNRGVIIALTAVLALGGLSMSNQISAARGGGGGMHFGGMRGGHSAWFHAGGFSAMRFARADLRADRRDIRADRRDIRVDFRAGRFAEARRDLRDIRRDRADLFRDRRIYNWIYAY
jgi:hypothetical protein